MTILFLTDSFNGMAQRLWIELDRHDHQVHVQIAVSGEAMLNAVEECKPDLIVAPILTKKIPEAIYKNHICLIVHPGIKGDRGASSLDWAILNEEKKWGVSIIQAVEKMDAGPLWATHNFKMRPATKAELYRNEVAQAAAKGILETIEYIEREDFIPEVINYDDASVKGKWNKKATQNDFEFSWEDHSSEIITKTRAADSAPGILMDFFGKHYYCYGSHLETSLKGKPGEILAQRNKAICVATAESAVWITHLKISEEKSIKLPATIALNEFSKEIPVSKMSPFETISGATWQEIRFEQQNDIGYLHFDFYNGAMSADQCNRLRETIIQAKTKVKMIVLMGGNDVWSNGIDLNIIEASKNSADTAWENINALDDLILEIIQSTSHYIICALQGNAGAGGVALALSGDKFIARNGIVLNPHTKNMGLYGSEYWTYLLPKRIGIDKATKFTEECLPWGMAVAKEIGLVDDYQGETPAEFMEFIRKQAESVRSLTYFDKLLMAKQFQQRKDEMNKPLSKYREEELAKMKSNFYEDDMGFAEKRYRFVHKIPNAKSHGISDLYASRRNIYRKRKWESITYNENNE